MSDFDSCANCGRVRKHCKCGEFRRFSEDDFNQCFTHKIPFKNGNCPVCSPYKFNSEVK